MSKKLIPSFQIILTTIIAIYGSVYSSQILEKIDSSIILHWGFFLPLLVPGLLIVYFAFFAETNRIIFRFSRYLRRRFRKVIYVGILSEIEWDEFVRLGRVWSPYNHDELIKRIEINDNVRVVKMKIGFRLNGYDVVINPYGAVYPEKDFETNESLTEIFNFVRNGGIFVNVADLPGYYAYNKDLHKLYDVGLGKDFDKTPFSENLLIKSIAFTSRITLNENIENKDRKMEIERVVKCSKYSYGTDEKLSYGITETYSSFLHLLVSEKEKLEVSPFFRQKIKKGSFIISMLNLGSKSENETNKGMIDIIISMAINEARNMKKDSDATFKVSVIICLIIVTIFYVLNFFYK